MAKAVHISDIHFPLLHKRNDGWSRRWELVTALVRKQKPDLIVVTGDVIDSARPQFIARPRLEDILTKQLPDAFDGIPFVVVPGNHDIKSIQGLGKRHKGFAAQFQELTRDTGGWKDPLHDRIHLFTIDSNYSEWFARGRIVQRELEKAVIPVDCADRHIHIFALHHSIRHEPARTGERALTSDERTLGLDDPRHLLATLSAYGFDVVLHGHRHLSTFDWYANPLADRRPEACLLIGAPSATKENAQGFNYIEDDAHGAFAVYAVRQAQGEFLEPQLVASRDYGEIRARRWRRQAEPGKKPTCDIVDVSITSYAEGTDHEKKVQKIGGDVQVEVTLHRPEHLEGTLTFPLTSIVGYTGIVRRATSVHWTNMQGREFELHVNDDGTIDARNVVDAQAIRIKTVVLNAIPSLGGDWSRMKSSQPDLQDVVDVRLALAARFLRLRVDLGSLVSLQPVARQPGSSEHLTPESEFTALYADPRADRCSQEIMTFRPLPGVGYCLTSSADPVIGAVSRPIPSGPADLQRRLADLQKMSALVRVGVQQELDRLRNEIIQLARVVPGAAGDGKDISVDLLSIKGGVRVEMTDLTSAARFEQNQQRSRSSVNVTFEWGLGVAGRALRLQKWLTWQRDQYESPHQSTWPARDWYVPVAKQGPHTYICCGPLMTDTPSGRYMVGMLSLASQDEPSLLQYIIAAMRDPDKFPKFNEGFNSAVSQFSVRLGTEISVG